MAATTGYPVSEGERFAADAVLEVVTCASCHMTYAIPQTLHKASLAHRGPRGWQIHCPLGHAWHYTGTTDEQRLSWERDRSARLAARADQAEASARSYKGAATRARRERDRERTRAAAGVCPCCKRTFKQLARHMAGQHPDFPTAGGEA